MLKSFEHFLQSTSDSTREAYKTEFIKWIRELILLTNKARTIKAFRVHALHPSNPFESLYKIALNVKGGMVYMSEDDRFEKLSAQCKAKIQKTDDEMEKVLGNLSILEDKRIDDFKTFKTLDAKHQKCQERLSRTMEKAHRLEITERVQSEIVTTLQKQVNDLQSQNEKDRYLYMFHLTSKLPDSVPYTVSEELLKKRELFFSQENVLRNLEVKPDLEVKTDTKVVVDTSSAQVMTNKTDSSESPTIIDDIQQRLFGYLEKNNELSLEVKNLRKSLFESQDRLEQIQEQLRREENKAGMRPKIMEKYSSELSKAKRDMDDQYKRQIVSLQTELDFLRGEKQRSCHVDRTDDENEEQQLYLRYHRSAFERLKMIVSHIISKYSLNFSGEEYRELRLYGIKMDYEYSTTTAPMEITEVTGDDSFEETKEQMALKIRDVDAQLKDREEKISEYEEVDDQIVKPLMRLFGINSSEMLAKKIEKMTNLTSDLNDILEFHQNESVSLSAVKEILEIVTRFSGLNDTISAKSYLDELLNILFYYGGKKFVDLLLDKQPDTYEFDADMLDLIVSLKNMGKERRTNLKKGFGLLESIIETVPSFYEKSLHDIKTAFVGEFLNYRLNAGGLKIRIRSVEDVLETYINSYKKSRVA